MEVTPANSELEEITEILENMEDQTLAVELLQKFNQKHVALNALLKDNNPLLDPAEWKEHCDELKEEIKGIVELIRSQA